MAVTIFSSSTKSVTTEWSIAADAAGPTTQTTAGAFQPWIDTNALAADSYYVFRLYEKGKTGGTQRLADEVPISGVLDNPIWKYPIMMLSIGWDMTLLKISGTTTSFDFHIKQGG